MNKYNFILISLSIIVVFSCNTKVNEIFYPNKKVFHRERKLALIETENKSFSEISSLIDKKYYKDSVPYIKVKGNNDTENNILVQNTHSHAKRRSILTVGIDSIYLDKGYSIKKLEELMTRHYSNNGKSYKYPMNSETAFIEIYLKPKSLKTIETINNVINVFNTVNRKFGDSLELKILFKREIPPPPPPPPLPTRAKN